jgi:hypothetical protein
MAGSDDRGDLIADWTKLPKGELDITNHVSTTIDQK